MIFYLILNEVYLFNSSFISILIFSLCTTLVPFIIIQPALGFGFFAKKTPNQLISIRNSLLAHIAFGTLENYREVRRVMLGDYAVIYKLRYPNISSLVMIGYASANDDQELDSSFFQEGNDFGYIDFSEWSEEDDEKAKLVLKEYEERNLVGKNKITEMTAEEFKPTHKKTRS